MCIGQVKTFQILGYVADSLMEIDREMSALVGMAWSTNTLATRNSQWRNYIEFCCTLGLSPVPAELLTVARYLVKLSTKCKYVTINNYLSAICVLHKFYGYQAEFRDCFLIKMIMSGIKSKYGAGVNPKMTLSVYDLRLMYSLLPPGEFQETCWAGIMFSFRTLLRKCNIVPSPNINHTLCRGDIKFTVTGMLVTVGSSKNLWYKERTLQIPIYYVQDPAFCVVTMLLKHFALFPAPSSSPLFLKRKGKKLVPVTYHELLEFIKVCVARIGMKPSDVGLHSLRRSGATYLHSIGVPLVDIKFLGDWKSLAVLQYLITTLDRKCQIESYFVSTLH